MKELDYEYLAELASRIQRDDGRGDAFAELYAATYQKQYQFAYRYLKDEHLAQDAIQETYLLVLKNIDRLKNTALFLSWMNQIEFRVCFHLQEKRRRYEAELTDNHETVLGAGGGQNEILPEEMALKREETSDLMQKINSLPPLQSKAMTLYYYNNMKIKDIAEFLNVSQVSVKRYLSKGRERLKEMFEEEGNYDAI